MWNRGISYVDARAELFLYFVVSYCSLSPCNASSARDIISSAREKMPSTRDIKAAYSVTMNIFRKKIIFFLNHL